MDREIDIWDQPPNIAPSLFISGVHAQIIGVDSTSESPMSAQLGQNATWPRILGQDIPHITHKVIIPYVAGLKSRMYLVYNDVDNGPRRFDIDRIVDPDEHKHELRILAIERNDGADPFDSMLNTTLDVLTRNDALGDEYGLGDPTFFPLAFGLPCRVLMGQSVPKGKEMRGKSNLTITYAKVFMRPWFEDQAPDGSFVPFAVVNGTTYNTRPLSHEHWLRIPSETTLNENGQATPGDLYDITDIDNPGMANHHLEVWCEKVLT